MRNSRKIHTHIFTHTIRAQIHTQFAPSRTPKANQEFEILWLRRFDTGRKFPNLIQGSPPPNVSLNPEISNEAQEIAKTRDSANIAEVPTGPYRQKADFEIEQTSQREGLPEKICEFLGATETSKKDLRRWFWEALKVKPEAPRLKLEALRLKLDMQINLYSIAFRVEFDGDVQAHRQTDTQTHRRTDSHDDRF